VGTLRVDFHIPGSGSLKEKRKVVRSLKDRIRARYPVAVAEVGHQDLRARGMIGVAAVSEGSGPVIHALDEIQRLFESDFRIQVIEAARDTF
jgi:uncharacterized protein YlxP (DUF503 family)